MFNKKLAQIGETITWMVATVIIIVILLISIFVSTSFLSGNKRTDFSAKQSDILASESFFAYLLTEDAGQTVYEQLKNEENLNDFNGNLAIKIFEEFYGREYFKVWVGTVLIRVVPIYEYTSNNFFGEDPEHIKSSYWGGERIYPHATTRIKLNKTPFVTGEENRYIELTLTKPN